jgi:DNA primase
LVKAGQRGYYDFYRDRLIVPTYATTGEVIAFGGRLLGDGEPKYLNTSTTPVYTKGRHLFGLNIARRAAAHEHTLIVVEGYLDCIALQQAGFENAVAALGTSFTEEQARELRKYADNIFLCFDGDTAGNNAASKAVDIATRIIEHSGSSVRIALLPDGEDPDSYVRANGAEGFRRLLGAAIPSIEFRLEAQAEGLRSGFESPATIARKAERAIQEMTPMAEWDRWRVWIAKRLKVDANDLRNSRFLANSRNFAPRFGADASTASRHVSTGIAPASFEREVIAIMLEEPALVDEFGERIPPSRFRNDVYRRMYGTIVEHAGKLNDTADVFSLFAEDSDSAAELSSIGQRDRSSTVRYEDAGQRRAHLERVVERLQLEDARERYQELSQQIDDLVTTGHPINPDLRNEYDTLVSKLKK